jgi:hypothetical protein
LLLKGEESFSTLKNPHNFPARKCALKAKEKYWAVFCDFSGGPHFRDLHVSANRHSGRAVGHGCGVFSPVGGVSHERKLKFSRSQTKQLFQVRIAWGGNRDSREIRKIKRKSHHTAFNLASLFEIQRSGWVLTSFVNTI